MAHEMTGLAGSQGAAPTPTVPPVCSGPVAAVPAPAADRAPPPGETQQIEADMPTDDEDEFFEPSEDMLEPAEASGARALSPPSLDDATARKPGRPPARPLKAAGRGRPGQPPGVQKMHGAQKRSDETQKRLGRGIAQPPRSPAKGSPRQARTAPDEDGYTRMLVTGKPPGGPCSPQARQAAPPLGGSIRAQRQLAGALERAQQAAADAAAGTLPPA